MPPVLTCIHCGNKAPFFRRTEYTHVVGEFPYTDVFWTTWTILQCPSCMKPTITEKQSNTFDAGKVVTLVLYPATKSQIGHLPESVKNAHEATLRVRYIDASAFAVLAGRTLEAICKEQGALGHNLAAKLKNLADGGRIPQTLAEMAQHIRHIRNLAAHMDDVDEVRPEDVPIINDFLEAILEYLYHAPAKVALVRNRLSRAPEGD